MKYRLISILDPMTLQDRVLQQLASTEGGLHTLAIGVDTQWGRLTLGLDPEGRLVVLIIRPSDVPDDANAPVQIYSENKVDVLLSPLIGIYGWILGMMPLFNCTYAQRGLNGAKPLRMLMIAPEYARAFTEGLAYLRFNVECYRWQGLESEGECSLFISPIPTPSPDVMPMEESRPTHGLLKSVLSKDELLFFKADPDRLK